MVLEDNTIFAYKVDSYYSPESDRGILYSDIDLDIDWRLDRDEIILSDRDRVHPKLNEVIELFEYGANYYV